MSWIHQADGYRLLCNRDERRSRPKAVPPRVERTAEGTAAAPLDAAGGTWIAVNDRGISICLLNGANVTGSRDRGLAPPRISRGLLVTSLMSATSASDVCRRAHHVDLQPYAAFTLVALERGMPAALFEWNGCEKAMVLDGESYMPLASSSLDADGARQLRRREFDRLTAHRRHITEDSLFAFHESHAGHAGPLSPCMHRSDAATVSFSRIAVTRDSADFFYAPGAPCESLAGSTVRLALTR